VNSVFGKKSGFLGTGLALEVITINVKELAVCFCVGQRCFSNFMHVSPMCNASLFPTLTMCVGKLLSLTVRVYEREKEVSSCLGGC